MSIEALEKLIDDEFLQTPIPVNNQNLCYWYLIMVSEDIILNVWRAQKNLHKISVLANDLKYSLKHCLSRAAKETSDHALMRVPTPVDAAIYLKSRDLLVAGIDFAAGTKLCTIVHSKLATAETQDHVIQIQHTDLWSNAGYSALEMIEMEPSPQTVLISEALAILDRPQKGRLYDEMGACARVDENGIVTYDFDSQLCLDFAKRLPYMHQLIPPEWKFPWCSGLEAIKLMRALTARSLYHISLIRSAAAKHSILGAGHESLCLVTTRQKLAEDLEALCEVPAEIALQFVNALVLGVSTTASDPALQPLIPINENEIIAGCLNLLTCRQDRNLLALHARVSPTSFDRQSEIFEKNMIASLAAVTQQRKFAYRCNINIPENSDAGDLDFVLADKRTKTLIIAELRWMIQPGDPREIINRAKACKEKVKKIQTKVETGRKFKRELLKSAFNEDVNPDEWNVQGIIIIEGYAGIESSNSDFPIIPLHIFKVGLNNFNQFDNLYAWCKSLAWLPQSKLHFAREPLITEKKFATISQPGFSLTEMASQYGDYVKKSTKRFKNRVPNRTKQ